MNQGRSAVRTRGLGRTFEGESGRRVAALQGLDLDLAVGDFVVVRGPSGCGKSTLLNLLGLLDRPTEGRLWIEGIEVQTLDATAAARFRREHVGFLFQDGGLIEPMSAFGNVELPLVYREAPPTERRRRVTQALEKVGLRDAAAARVGALSGGERQRVGLARALATAPSLLLCDEPTAALDENNSRLIVNMLLAHAAEGRTVVCSSHDPVVIARAHRIVELNRGRLASPESLT